MNKRMFAVVIAGLWTIGCGGDKASGSGAPSSTGKIGVKACDDYIAKMEACFLTMSPSERLATEESFKKTREAWKEAASRGGAAPESLQQGCEAALLQLRQPCK